MPALVRLEQVQLKEGAGQLLAFPRRGRFACAQPHDRVLHAHGLAGLHPDVADDAVALVEEADDRHPFLHRRDSRLLARTAARAR